MRFWAPSALQYRLRDDATLLHYGMPEAQNNQDVSFVIHTILGLRDVGVGVEDHDRVRAIGRAILALRSATEWCRNAKTVGDEVGVPKLSEAEATIQYGIAVLRGIVLDMGVRARVGVSTAGDPPGPDSR
jgi:hypothetical protein